MKRLKSRVISNVNSVLENYNRENGSIEFDIPSLMKYCIENEVRHILKEKKMSDEQINSVFQSINFDVRLSQNLSNRRKVRINLVYDKIG